MCTDRSHVLPETDLVDRESLINRGAALFNRRAASPRRRPSIRWRWRSMVPGDA